MYSIVCMYSLYILRTNGTNGTFTIHGNATVNGTGIGAPCGNFYKFGVFLSIRVNSD